MTRPPAALMGGVSTHAIQRSLAAVSIGTIRAREERVAQDLIDANDEYDQQFQVPYTGTLIGRDPLRVTVQLTFAVRFIREPVEYRDSPYEFPHFTYGDEQTGLDESVVFTHAVVRRWIYDEDEVTGVEVMILLHNPFAADDDPDAANKEELRFNGVMHLNFEGYAAAFDPTEDDD